MIVDHVVEGREAAPAVILSTSIGTTRDMWQGPATVLAEQFRVIRYDHRGHGRSAVPPGPYEIGDLGRDVIALMDHLGLRRASFCGVSLGGMVGMWLGENAPERIERLVLCCTAASMEPETWTARIAAIRAAGTVEVIASAAVERWFTPAFRASQAKTVSRMEQMLAEQPVEGYAGCAAAIAHMDLRARLQEITVPTLVLAGSEDVSTPPARGVEISEAIPGARLVILDGAAHLANVEQEDTVTQLILEHLT